MANHFSAIGFPISNRDEFQAVVEQAAAKGRPLPVSNGRYILWSPGAGEELWVQVSAENQIIGCNPHFSGEGRVETAITDLIATEGSDLDGSIYGWASPGDDPSGTNGAYPFVVDLPDFLVARHSLALPQIVPLQVAAFAHELRCFSSDEEYTAAQGSERPGFATESFIPAGLFRPEGTSTSPPRAHAILTGHILQAEMRTNPTTGARFHTLLVQSFGGIYDVVAAPDTLAGPIAVGGVVQGSFWLSGRVIQSETLSLQ